MADRDLSLIICSRDRADMLHRCLAALDGAELTAANAELVLIDSASRDGTPRVMREFAERAPFPVRVEVLDRPGTGVARSAGLAASGGRVIAFTDDDCYLAPGYLRRARSLFESCEGGFKWAGGRVLLWDPADSSYGCYEHDRFQLYPARRFVPVGVFQTANLVLHRDVVDRIGGFDPLFGAGAPFRGEDVDYCARASLAGFAGAFVPDLVVYHHHGRRDGHEIARIERENAYACGAYYTKLARLGCLGFAPHWLRAAARPRNWGKKVEEIVGARAYLRALREAPPVSLEVPLDSASSRSNVSR